jgi:thiol:disulfide interchange protein DsbD
MTRFLSLLILIWLPAFPASAETAGEVRVRVEAIQSRDRYPAGGIYPILLELRIPEGWYIHGPAAEPGKGDLIPTTINFDAPPGLGIRLVRFAEPEPVSLPFQPEPAPLYQDTVLVRVQVAVDEEVSAGDHLVQGRLAYQACSDRVCLPPETSPVLIPVSVAPPGTETSRLNQRMFQAALPEPSPPGSPFGLFRGTGTLITLLGLFLGGLALNLTPCIYPLIPITVSYFGGRSRTSRGRTLVHGGLYLAGLAATNSALGVAAALSGGILGAVLQSPWVLGGVAALLLAMALSFFGLWELRPPAALTRLASRQVGGYLGSAFMGLTLGVVAAPCIGPFILGLLAYVGRTGDPVLGFAWFFVLSLGMGLPLALLGVFSGAIDRLPGSGDWMVWVRKVLGWILVAMAVYMIRPILPEGFPEPWLLAGLAWAAAVHLGWLERTGRTSPRFRSVRKVTGVLLVAAGLTLLWQAGERTGGISWTPYRPGILAEAEGTPVLLEFSADWCAPCRELEERVFSERRVVEAAGAFTTIKVDLTRRQPEHEAVRKRFSVRGVPTVVFLDAQGREIRELRVQSFVEPSDFLNRMERALERQAPAEENPPTIRLFKDPAAARPTSG